MAKKYEEIISRLKDVEIKLEHVINKHLAMAIYPRFMYYFGHKALRNGRNEVALVLFEGSMKIMVRTSQFGDPNLSFYINRFDKIVSYLQVENPVPIYKNILSVIEYFYGADSLISTYFYDKIGLFYFKKDMLGEAIKINKRIITIFEKYDNKYIEEIAQIYKNISFLYYRLDKYSLAREYLKISNRLLRV